MGASDSRPSVGELMDQIEAGDTGALNDLWDRIDKDGGGVLEDDEYRRCVRLVYKSIEEDLENMDDPEKLKKFALCMVRPFVRAKLDPNCDNRISKEEFAERVPKLLEKEED